MEKPYAQMMVAPRPAPAAPRKLRRDTENL